MANHFTTTFEKDSITVEFQYDALESANNKVWISDYLKVGDNHFVVKIQINESENKKFIGTFLVFPKDKNFYGNITFKCYKDNECIKTNVCKYVYSSPHTVDYNPDWGFPKWINIEKLVNDNIQIKIKIHDHMRPVLDFNNHIVCGKCGDDSASIICFNFPCCHLQGCFTCKRKNSYAKCIKCSSDIYYTACINMKKLLKFEGAAEKSYETDDSDFEIFI